MTGEPGSEGPKVVFVHIPKTAGVALYDALERWATPERSLRYADGGLEDWERHRRITNGEIDRLRLISGHIGFEAFSGDARFADWLPITIVREPVRRILSLYSYAKGTPGHPWHERLAGTDVDDFVDFLAEDAFNTNSQCQMISGGKDAEAALGMLSSRFFLAASTENLKRMLPILSRRLGTALSVGRVNESPTRVDPRRVESDTLARIRRMNDQDSVLYERVRDAGIVGAGADRSRRR